jgi:diadenosine tetraphosphate (Ap4A) HIT family hydrolase
MATHQNDCLICEQVRACREGRHPGQILEMDTGFAVLGDSQFFEGYSLLLSKEPVTELDEFPGPLLRRHLEEMAQLAAAVRIVTNAYKINYEALGNIVHHMHWHIFPRRLTDPAPEKPVWVQMPTGEESERYRLKSERHAGLIERIRQELLQLREAEAPDMR